MTVTDPTCITPVPARMQVRKRNGDAEPVDLNKIVRAVERCAAGLAEVDPMRVATRTISGLYDGATTAELDRLSVQTAAEMTGEEPQYSRLAARLLSGYIGKEVRGQGIASFSQGVSLGHAEGLISDRTAAFAKDHARKLDDAIDPAGDLEFEYFGIKTVYDRYLLRHPATRLVIETPQYFLLRVACGLSQAPAEAIGFYRLMSSLAYLPSSPTLFNSGTSHPQLSSCFLVDSPRDDLNSIYDRYAQVARLSKFSGGIGIAWSRVRSRGALIRGTNGQSNGIVPFLRTLDASVAAVNQGGRRKGAACVYLEPWHPDIEEFLELRDNTGEDARRTHNLNLANWIPDEFMRRVEADQMWSLIDPDQVPELPDLHSDLPDLGKLSPAERHLVSRLVAFFATGDTIVANNLVLNLYQHVNSPEGRLYLSRQLFEEAVHVQFYLTLLDTYVPDERERAAAFAAVENIPSIARKAQFCFRWIDSVFGLRELRTAADRRAFLLNLICFAACIEGLFFYGAFAYVYFLRSRGLLNGLASGTNWVFRDESMHMAFAFDVVDTVRAQEPGLFDEEMAGQVREMLAEAVECEVQFAEDLLGHGVAGLSLADMRAYLEHVADRRLAQLGLDPLYGSANPLAFMDLQDVQELSNFFERRVSAYQVGVTGEVSFEDDF
jgi:ribonucleotide reductase beta subunit family protein with ferritin-like domain